MIALLFITALDVHFVTKVEPRAWQPIEPKDVEKLIEQKALDQLTKKGLIKLTKGGFAELKTGEYSLLIEARFIEEAEKFSTYITFGPGTKSAVPSFYVIDTADIGDRSPGDMQKVIMMLVERAAKRLTTLLDPHIGGATDIPIEPEPTPLDFGAIEVPEIKQPTGAVAKLINPRNPDHERGTAYGELEKHVFDQPAARAAVERCAIADPLPSLRARCVDALAPVARNRLETQRLLLMAMRREVEPNVLQALAKVSQSFVGISRKEALSTWLDVVSAEGTPGEVSDDIARLIAEENNIPNLELTVARCMNTEAMAYGKKQACVQYLLPKVPKERRTATLVRYLETTRAPEQNLMSDLERYVFHDELDLQMAQTIEKVVWQTRMRNARHTLIYALRKHPKPTADTITAMLRTAANWDQPFSLWNTLPDMVRAHPEIKETTIAQLKRFAETQTWLVHPSSGNPNKELRDCIARLEKIR